MFCGRGSLSRLSALLPACLPAARCCKLPSAEAAAPAALPPPGSLMESRFPVSHSAGHARVEFAWFDAFRPQVCWGWGWRVGPHVVQWLHVLHGAALQPAEPAVAAAFACEAGPADPCRSCLPRPAPQKRAEQASLHFEKAAIAFNLGAVQVRFALIRCCSEQKQPPAVLQPGCGGFSGRCISGLATRKPCPCAFRPPLQSQLALACDRKTDAGLKESAKLFQVRGRDWRHPCCVSNAAVWLSGWSFRFGRKTLTEHA